MNNQVKWRFHSTYIAGRVLPGPQLIRELRAASLVERPTWLVRRTDSVWSPLIACMDLRRRIWRRGREVWGKWPVRRRRHLRTRLPLLPRHHSRQDGSVGKRADMDPANGSDCYRPATIPLISTYITVYINIIGLPKAIKERDPMPWNNCILTLEIKFFSGELLPNLSGLGANDTILLAYWPNGWSKVPNERYGSCLSTEIVLVQGQ